MNNTPIKYLETRNYNNGYITALDKLTKIVIKITILIMIIKGEPTTTIIALIICHISTTPVKKHMFRHNA